MGGRPAMPAWPGRPAGRIFFLRGPARRPPSGSIWRPRPLKKKVRPAGRPGQAGMAGRPPIPYFVQYFMYFI